jgi:hypothetical protein
MKSTNSAEPDIIEMSRMYRFERDQRIILEKQIAALTFESITVPFSERFEQFIEALPSCQMRSNLRWIQSNFCKTHQEVISMSNGACPYCEAAAPAQPQHKITPCMKCEDDFGAAPSPVLQAIERGARELFRIGNERIGERKWEDVAEHYLAESAACLRAAAQSEYQAARASSPAVVPTSQNRCPNEEIAKRDELLGEWCDSWNDLTLRDRRDSIQDALFDKTNAIWPTAWPPIEESCKRCNSAYGRGMEKAADATNEYLDRNGATPANGRGLYLRLDELLKLAVPAVAPKCPNCESTDPLTPGILTCGHEFHTPAVARRTQGDWKVGHDGPSRPIIEHGMRMFSVNEFKNGKWGSFEDEERLSQTIVDALNLAALRESAREATSDDLIEALKTIADAPTHITYEGIFVSTNVKDVARKALRAERNEASPEAPAALNPQICLKCGGSNCICTGIIMPMKAAPAAPKEK